MSSTTFTPYAKLVYDGRSSDTHIFAVEEPNKEIKIGFVSRLELSIDLSGSNMRLWFAEMEDHPKAEEFKPKINQARDLAKKCRNVIVMS